LATRFISWLKWLAARMRWFLAWTLMVLTTCMSLLYSGDLSSLHMLKLKYCGNKHLIPTRIRSPYSASKNRCTTSAEHLSMIDLTKWKRASRSSNSGKCCFSSESCLMSLCVCKGLSIRVVSLWSMIKATRRSQMPWSPTVSKLRGMKFSGP